MTNTAKLIQVGNKLFQQYNQKRNDGQYYKLGLYKDIQKEINQPSPFNANQSFNNNDLVLKHVNNELVKITIQNHQLNYLYSPEVGTYRILNQLNQLA